MPFIQQSFVNLNDVEKIPQKIPEELNETKNSKVLIEDDELSDHNPLDQFLKEA